MRKFLATALTALAIPMSFATSGAANATIGGRIDQPVTSVNHTSHPCNTKGVAVVAVQSLVRTSDAGPRRIGQIQISHPRNGLYCVRVQLNGHAKGFRGKASINVSQEQGNRTWVIGTTLPNSRFAPVASKKAINIDARVTLRKVRAGGDVTVARYRSNKPGLVGSHGVA